MLEMAIRARLPLIAVRTRDPLNVAAMLEHFADGLTVVRASAPVRELGRPKVQKDSLYVVGKYEESGVAALFEMAAGVGSVLVFVNPEEIHPAMFDAGEIHLPDAMLREFIAEYAPDETVHYELEAALRGLTFKEVVEVSKLAMVESGEFTADAVLRVRRARTVLSSGLRLVDTHQYYYEAPQALTDWLAVDGRLFTANVDIRVRPRGLLFAGPPGTGKTSGAKYLAHKLKVPLYMLDVGATMQKWVGESERTFQSALTQIDTLGPCVLLLDEVEKAFDHNDESGVSRRVLGTLLWWLQEHASQVLTIMTTNRSDEIPAELIRPGRVDRVITFGGLTRIEARAFVKGVARSLPPPIKIYGADVEAAIDKLSADRTLMTLEFTQAELHQLVVDLAKVQMAALLKE